jgi:2-dehydro-3-deoxy-D-arabinonate dehydratase
VRIVRYLDPSGPRPGVLDDGGLHPVDAADVATLLRQPVQRLREMLEAATTGDVIGGTPRLLAPLDGRTEVWAAGVSYERSRDARMEESSEQSVYDRVHAAERPELFFESAAWRVVPDGQPTAVRADSLLNVPEPEVGLVLNPDAEVVGYLVVDDVSSRSIEGDDPLHLPQAKVYAGSCSASTGIVPDMSLSLRPGRHRRHRRVRHRLAVPSRPRHRRVAAAVTAGARRWRRIDVPGRPPRPQPTRAEVQS